MQIICEHSAQIVQSRARRIGKRELLQKITNTVKVIIIYGYEIGNDPSLFKLYEDWEELNITGKQQQSMM